jgi:hypothetical protein
MEHAFKFEGPISSCLNRSQGEAYLHNAVGSRSYFTENTSYIKCIANSANGVQAKFHCLI